MKQFLQLTFALFGCLCILFIPFPYALFPVTGAVSGFLFNDFLLFLAGSVFHIKGVVPQNSSDSVLMYLLVLVLLFLSALMSLAMRFLKMPQHKCNLLIETSRLAGSYYLALHLMKYGADKLFKAQFYLPEPNILYTPFGQLDTDMLYWSTMGISYSYNLFLGIAEVIAASLLLFKRTRVLGLLSALLLMVNIVAVNFSFHISVKLFSLFLLLLSVWLLVPYLRKLYQFLVLQEATAMSAAPPVFSHPFWKTTLKTAAVLFIVSEALHPHLHKTSLNDDNLPRPYLHGAYEVMKAKPAKEQAAVKRVFIHRKGYLIIETEEGDRKDYKLKIDQAGERFVLTDYAHQTTTFRYQYSAQDSTLVLTLPGDSLPFINARALNWKTLPALQPKFRWTIDAE